MDKLWHVIAWERDLPISEQFREGRGGMYSRSDNEDEGMIFNVICLNT